MQEKPAPGKSLLLIPVLCSFVTVFLAGFMAGLLIGIPTHPIVLIFGYVAALFATSLFVEWLESRVLIALEDVERQARIGWISEEEIRAYIARRMNDCTKTSEMSSQ